MSLTPNPRSSRNGDTSHWGSALVKRIENWSCFTGSFQGRGPYVAPPGGERAIWGSRWNVETSIDPSRKYLLKPYALEYSRFPSLPTSLLGRKERTKWTMSLKIPEVSGPLRFPREEKERYLPGERRYTGGREKFFQHSFMQQVSLKLLWCVPHRQTSQHVDISVVLGTRMQQWTVLTEQDSLVLFI